MLRGGVSARASINGVGERGGHRARMRATLSVRTFERRAGRGLDRERAADWTVSGIAGAGNHVNLMGIEALTASDFGGALADPLSWTLRWAADVAYWWARNHENPASSLWEAGLTPVFELRRPLASRASHYFEAGIAVHLLSHTHIDELRSEYEGLPETADYRADVENFEAIDARLRKAFRWLEQAITYLNRLKPPIDPRFDLGYGFAFDSPRFAHGSVGQQERRIVGFPVLEAIDVYYEISASKPLSIEVVPGWVSFAEKTLDAFGLQYSCRRVDEPDGTLSKCIFAVPPVIPARVAFRADYRRGLVTVALVNVDRLERVTLEFPSPDIDEPMLQDLVRLILGRDSAFLKRAPLAGLHSRASG